MIKVRIVVRLCKEFGDNAKSPTTYTQAYLSAFIIVEINLGKDINTAQTLFGWLPRLRWMR